MHRPHSEKSLDTGGRGCRAGERLAELGRPDAGIPQLEVAALPDHHRVALELGVLAQRRRQEDAARAIGRDMLFESEQQAFPPARLRVKRRKRLDPGADWFPGGLGVNEHTSLGMGSQHHRPRPVQQRTAMTRGDGDATFGVERDDRRSVESCPHNGCFTLCFATFSYLFPLYGESVRWSSGNI
jgi:hypothetical protein